MEDGVITPRDTTMTFTCFVLFDLFNSQPSLSDQVGLFTNKMFLYTVGGSLLGQLLIIYMPPLQAIFQMEALTSLDLGFLFCLCSSVLLVDEVRKLMRRLFLHGSRHWFSASVANI